ncbi:transcriptional regulatory protein SrrA [Thermoclostridium stercorarium subsp. stercorarium DSM 8532]|jgi:DNA-binding response OmpR family regulator|uniref:Stage 0 sporulation protein A homolog n=3 Tax=Thermoclostridium stercorarium TaxID=1510 RepID=L7VMM5_THES1|nr:response regulator transcription factor [Thermoclostridium stercorarium]AGC67904.1 transcriptional regulatory protein SrrA [Thermoclostridium stercorarium subsp. stercorarium DSM 8532]AGI38945.1 response regulator [Thermoclostridium stercorarium subsp. stercorarium DSM 8532]ANW98313.1 two-component system response regulator [Thermoclostridium stercorarium subsp. thermolacticum DSM 2910]ANX00840.1 two-component system response regulator [Thermoclostridium stercorarium subsp. leptospartum DSM 
MVVDEKRNILVVDDDEDLCKLLKDYLEKQSYNVDIKNNGVDALLSVLKREYALIVLDIMMPLLDGLDTLKKIRETSSVPVLMLTAKAETEDKVKGLNTGADDYGARVNSLIRRATEFNAAGGTKKGIYVFDNLEIDDIQKKVFLNSNEVKLNPKEYQVLLYLAQNAGRVFTKKQIYEAVWEEPYEYDDSNIMSVISRLRSKIESVSGGEKHKFIETVKGMGYRFVSGGKK